MNFKKILGTLVLASICGFSQTQQFTMNDAVLGLRTNLAVKNIRDFSFSNDGKSYLQMVKNAYLITDIATNKSDTLVSLYQVNQNLSADQKLKALSPMKFLNSSGEISPKPLNRVISGFGFNFSIASIRSCSE